MSTKTTFKRVAAVAAAALAISGFSAVSANATKSSDATATFTVTGNTGTGAAAVVSSTVSTYQAITLNTAATDSVYTVSSAGVGSLNVPAITAGSETIATAGVTSTSAIIFASKTAADVPGTKAETFGGSSFTQNALAFSAYSATPGTQTITVKGDVTTSAITLTITWGAAPAVTTQYSTAQIISGTAPTGFQSESSTAAPYTGTNAVVSASSTAGVNVALIAVQLASASNINAANPIAGYLTATISGAGSIGVAGYTGSTALKAASAPANMGTSITLGTKYTDYLISVWSNGVAGVGTITLTSGTTAIATKTVTFYSAAVKAVATQNLKVAKVSTRLGMDESTGVAGAGTSVATLPAFTVALTDALGNAASGATISAKSSDTKVISNPSCTEITLTPGTYQCSVTGAAGALSGQTATVTFSVRATAAEVADATTGLYSITTNPLTFAIGGSVSNVVLSTDATDYTPLAPVKLVATVTDSKGNAVYDQDFDNTTAPLLVSLKSTLALGGGTLTSPTKTIGGVGSYSSLYAPSIEGTVSVTGLDNLSVAGEAVSTSFTVSGGAANTASQAAVDAAQEATDAANAAYDAANNAMDSADAATAAAQDASDNASAALAAVTSLSATVAKLVKSVAAIAAALAKVQKKIGA